MDIRVERIVVITLVAFVLKLLVQHRVKWAHDLPLELKVLHLRTVPWTTTKETSPREEKHAMENTKRSLKTSPWVTCRVGWEGFFNLSIFFTFSAISSNWADMLLSVISANGLQYRSTSTAPTEHVQERGWLVKAQWWTLHIYTLSRTWTVQAISI